MVKEDFDIRNASDATQIIDCIEENTYGDAPKALFDFFEKLPDTPEMNYLRTLCVPILFHEFEKNVNTEVDAVANFVQNLLNLKTHVSQLAESGSIAWMLSRALERTDEERFAKDVKTHTGQHYGTLFKAFDPKNYFDEAKNILNDRLVRNEVNLGDLKDKSLLDQGCGGGRYTTAWKLLGVGQCTGLDFSEIGLEDARKRVAQAELTGIDFKQGSVLDMPFEDESFDMVFSNGVLHHTEDWKKGISEQLRVMRSGGWGWQYLIENPGGIFWDQIEILRGIMRKVPKEFAQQVMRGMGVPSNRIFYMLDHVMVPINTRVTSEQLQSELEKNGAIEVRRLTRGTGFDRVEAIYRKVPFAKEKFGVGEHRFVFRKK